MNKIYLALFVGLVMTGCQFTSNVKSSFNNMTLEYKDEEAEQTAKVRFLTPWIRLGEYDCATRKFKNLGLVHKYFFPDNVDLGMPKTKDFSGRYFERKGACQNFCVCEVMR